MRKEFKIDFIGKRKIFDVISCALILVALLVSVIFGVKMDINFTGGAMLTYSYSGDVDADSVVGLVEDTIGQEAEIRLSSDIASGQESMVISLSGTDGLTVEQEQQVTAALQEAYPDNGIESVEISNVNAIMGREFFAKCLVAVGFSAVLMIIYIAIRFKRISGWSAGVTAVIALLHDVAMVYATFVIFRMPLDDNFIAVALTILGYSINDTIVVYDRVRENKRIYGKSLNTAELMNKSLNQSLSRSIHTSVTTIMAMTIVLIISIIFGIESIFTFAFPMIIGMISGVYSTLCISSSLWVDWQNHKEKRTGHKKAVTA